MREHTQEAVGNIDTLKALSGATDEELGAVVGVTGNGFSKRLRLARAGVGDLSIEQCALLAEGFGFPLHVLFLPRPEFLAWLAEHNPSPKLVVDLTRDEGLSGSDWIMPLDQRDYRRRGLLDLLSNPLVNLIQPTTFA